MITSCVGTIQRSIIAIGNDTEYIKAAIRPVLLTDDEMAKARQKEAKIALTQAKNVVCAAAPVEDDCAKLTKELK